MTRKQPLRIAIILAALHALCIVTVSAGLCAPPSTYLEGMSSAIGAMEVGRTSDCVVAAQAAMEFNANDPLAHVTLGLALLCGKRSADALAEFNTAVGLAKDCAPAMYGKGLFYLSEKNYDYATSAFTKVQAMDPSVDVQGELGYIQAIKSGAYPYTKDASDSPLKLSMNAVWLMSQNRHSEAKAILQDLLAKTGTMSFRERPGCGVTFLRSNPISVGGASLVSYVKAVSKAKSKVPVISGTISLRADLSRASSVKMVLFFVDGKLVGITNTPPFQYSWDTHRVANGPHTIKIEGCDADSSTLTEKSTQVVVKNSGGAAPSAVVTGKEADALWQRLWELLRLKTSQAAINYNLGVCALAGGDKQVAKGAFERVLAANPDYLDAGDRLAALYGPTKLPEKLYWVKTSEKKIVLTFDDGPKAKTPQLLDLLDKKDVKATFFVVGKMAVNEPAMIKRMVKSGHQIANHTYNHQDLEYLSTRDITQELFTNAVLIRQATGQDPRFMRPPGAHTGNKLSPVLKKFGITNVMWVANCSKFEGTTPQKMADYVISLAKPGGIVLMHNVEGVTLSALPIVIDTLKARGYTFVTITELTSGAGG